ncbi:MAG TPA: transposase [Clostridia bacterium]
MQDLYQQPYDPDYHVVSMDEKPYQLLGETRQAIPMKRGRPKRQDDEYIRNGTFCIFLFTETLTGWQHTDPQEHRTKVDWAHQIRYLLEIMYPDCQKVRLVINNLNIHSISSLYEAFPLDIARNLARRLEIHHTPKHGSWLNIAEIELSAMTKHASNAELKTSPP